MGTMGDIRQQREGTEQAGRKGSWGGSSLHETSTALGLTALECRREAGNKASCPLLSDLELICYLFLQFYFSLSLLWCVSARRSVCVCVWVQSAGR